MEKERNPNLGDDVASSGGSISSNFGEKRMAKKHKVVMHKLQIASSNLQFEI
jgi:hypothetical protein